LLTRERGGQAVCQARGVRANNMARFLYREFVCLPSLKFLSPQGLQQSLLYMGHRDLSIIPIRCVSKLTFLVHFDGFKYWLHLSRRDGPFLTECALGKSFFLSH